MVIQISYELRRPGQNYEGLYQAIKSISGTWSHPLTSHWLIQTTLTPQQVWERLAPHIDKNDSMLVIRITREQSGWLPQPTWNWLNARVY